MIGLIAYLSSTVFFSPALCLLVFLVVLYRFVCHEEYKVIGFLDKSHVAGGVLLFISVIMAFIVFITVDPLVENFERGMLGGIPYVGLIFMAAMVGVFFNEKDVTWLLYLIVFEILIGIAEFIMGTHSFFGVSYLGETQIGDTDIIYYNRVFGASSNSSVYAFKVLVGFIIYNILKPDLAPNLRRLLSVIIVLGFITSFNRTAIVSALLWLVVLNFRDIKALSALLFGFLILIGLQYDKIVYSFSRGKGEVDLSGRDQIFSQFYSILEQSPLFGNAARKVWLEMGGSTYHAHNSYIEFIVSNGVMVSLVFFLGYYLLVLKGRMIFAFPMLVYSLFQYGVLWGFVFHDIVFFGLMFYVLKTQCRRGDLLGRQSV